MKLRLTAFLAVLAVAAGVAAGWVFLDQRRMAEGRAAGQEAANAAVTYAADMLSYDYRTIQEDRARARAHATGDLVGRLDRLAKTLAPAAARQKTVQQAVVAGAAVESATPDEARVLVFLNVTTSSSETTSESPRQQVVQNRARLVMVRIDDRWLVSDLSTLLGNTPIR
ncbi:hypothetical protein Aph01nite_38130 [Acrocarpospora phusangensis]|uniref:Mce-associated membrane protein n=1 Tax=Acrocarpospora phusangensis TaxID=1070424 RepID=A0A919UPL8_9ACTN|nr:hypothetical protein [Acrocarpospora phusangensis]GIH25503.1 hypothetical protein Aph01nite_38130 [Acrocarpospora phusangensis]